MTTGHPTRGPAPVTDQAWAADTLDDHWATTGEREALDEGGTHLLDLVAAVDHLARGIRHDLTVWDALEEALRWWLTEHASRTDGTADEDVAAASDEDDPLRAQTARLLDLVARDPGTTVADAVQQAIRQWATTMAGYFNGGYHWPHPIPRRSFPPPLTHP